MYVMHGTDALNEGEPMQKQAKQRSENGLRVLRSAEASRLGQGGRQPRYTRAVRSEKCIDAAAERRRGMRVVPACFSPYAPDALVSHIAVFSPDFKRFERLAKRATRSWYA
jgi:hypothetical protein